MIDVHAHLFFDELLGQAGPYGPRVERGPDGWRLTTGAMAWPLADPALLSVTPEARLAALDRVGIDHQVVSISPLWLFHHASHDLAESFARRANDLLAGWCSQTAGRGLALAQVATQRPEAAAEELRRCVRELGMVGAYLASDARLHLDDSELDPVYEACVELDVPLFIHPAMPGIDGRAGDPRLDRWTGQAVIGYPLEDTITATSFLLGDVLDRHPDLDVCLAHAGGGVALLWGRLCAFARTGRAPVSEGTLVEHLSRLWFDVHVHSTDAEAYVRRILPESHLVFGSNFGGWDSESLTTRPDAGLADNARRLLRLNHPPATLREAPTTREALR